MSLGTLIVIWIVGMPLSILIGNLVLFVSGSWRPERKTHTWRKAPGFAAFVAQQARFYSCDPGWAAFIGALWPVTLPIALLGNGGPYDVSEDVTRETLSHYRRWIRQKTGSDRSCHFETAEWLAASDMRAMHDAAIRNGDAVDQAARFGSFAAILFSVLLIPFAMFVPNAHAQTKEEESVEGELNPDPDPVPLKPPSLKFGGAVTMIGAVTVPTNGDTPTAQARIPQVWATGNAGMGNWSATVIFNAANLPGGDPVILADIGWRAMPWLALKAGRVATPIGLSRNPPPHKKLTGNYAAGAVTTPLLDHGMLARFSPNELITIDIGMITGDGRTFTNDPRPDLLTHLKFRPGPLAFSVYGQAGPQADRWRGSAGGTAEVLLNEIFVAMAEVTVSANWNDRVSDVQMGWEAMLALQAVKGAQIYAQLSGLERFGDNQPIEHQLWSGVNLLPVRGIALRAGWGLPLTEMPAVTLQLSASASF